ncbi:MAG: LPS-assembly protein LptD [Alphaproteobacteria bacterium]|nr:MAG: LPS-assembly protein LptD [Alphaproteobacteria bacterium]
MNPAAYQLPVRNNRAAGIVVRVVSCGLVLISLGAVSAATPAFSQIVPSFESPINTSRNARMLLEADQLIYDFDNETVSAIGNVQIFYDGYSIEAAKVIYYQRSGRLVASGGVRIVEPNGNIVTASQADLTDDLRDGFVENINVQTVGRARFAARSAERRDGKITIFTNGVYTACEPCRENPDRPPLWQIKATKIIVNQQEKTVRYENASLEFYGVPIAWLPFLFHPDPTVKRKTGFLQPYFGYSDALGVSATTPFFWNIAPDKDITFVPTVYSKQGFLGQVEWRQRLMNGSYNIRLAGILQQNITEFVDENGDRLSGFRKQRGSVQTSGQFRINNRWMWGWDFLASSDRTFGRDYSIPGATERDVTNAIYLTGMSERNYFDLQAYAFKVQRENTVDTDVITSIETVHDDQEEQAIVLPIFDHSYIFDQPIFGGELQIQSNFTSLTRAEHDLRTTPPMDYYAGVAGTFTRASTNVSWQRTLVGMGGQMLTPFAYLKADVNWSAPDPALPGDPPILIKNEIVGQAMPAIGLEYKWLFLATGGSTTQTFGPIAQIIVRPNETHIGDLPNDDAQSLVFDDTILFSRDKYSGYDRQEGGTRANVGFTYQARFNNGASIDTLFGQSFQLAGVNSFAQGDVLPRGSFGLESSTSDFVGGIEFDNGHGFSVAARGRFDSHNFTLNRSEITANAVYGRSSASLGFVHLRKQPILGIVDDRQEISGRAKIALNNNWAASGSFVYDIENKAPVTHTIGLAFDNECFNLSVTYSNTRDTYDDIVENKQFFVRLNLRTIGDSNLIYKLDE